MLVRRPVKMSTLEGTLLMRSKYGKPIAVLVTAFTLAAMLSACGDDDPKEPAGDNAGAGGTYDVVGKEYEFVEMPDSVPAGESTFNFENAGLETHEMLVVKNDSDKTTEELLELSFADAQEFVDILGGTGAEPMEAAKQPVKGTLEAGNYFLLCTLQGKDNKPHFTKGMVHEFEVTG
jgi:hypothetical protein